MKDKTKLELIDLYSEVPFFDRLFITLRIKHDPVHMELLERYIPKQGKIIDLGCGHGIFANYLALTSSDRTVLGIDLSKKRIDIAQRTLKNRSNIEFWTGDIRDTEIDSCNGIVIIGVLFLIPYEAQDALLKLCYEKLQDDGVLIIHSCDTKPRRRYWLTYTKEIIMRVTRMTLSEGLYFRSVEDMSKVLSEIGFQKEIITIPSWRLQTMIYICRKQ